MTTQTNITVVSPSEAAAALVFLIQQKQPVCLWGPPGCGKSQISQQVTASLKRAYLDVRPALRDPVDFCGVPSVQNGLTVWNPPAFLPRAGAGVLSLEELNRAPVMTQNACFQLVLDRALGEYRLPADWDVISCCNRESDGGGIQAMSAALRNRFTHLEIDPNHQDANRDWCTWAASAGIEPVVIAFVRWKPELLYQFSRTERAWPSFRSWEFISRIIAGNPAPNIEHALFAGTVGHGAAVEFSAFSRLYRNLPSIDNILLNASTAPVPTNPAELYAVSAALARFSADANFNRVLTYAARMPQEYDVLTVKTATGRNPQLATNPGATAWFIAHQGVTL